MLLLLQRIYLYFCQIITNSANLLLNDPSACLTCGFNERISNQLFTQGLSQDIVKSADGFPKLVLDRIHEYHCAPRIGHAKDILFPHRGPFGKRKWSRLWPFCKPEIVIAYSDLSPKHWTWLENLPNPPNAAVRQWFFSQEMPKYEARIGRVTKRFCEYSILHQDRIRFLIFEEFVATQPTEIAQTVAMFGGVVLPSPKLLLLRNGELVNAKVFPQQYGSSQDTFDLDMNNASKFHRKLQALIAEALDL